MSWNFGKNITLKLEDALFSSASQSLMTGWLDGKVSKYISIIRKISVANKYGELHYSTTAYPSPEITEEEWELIYKLIGNPNATYPSDVYYIWETYLEETSLPRTTNIIPITKEFIDQPYVGQMRKIIRDCYYNRDKVQIHHQADYYLAFDPDMIKVLLKELNTVDDYYKIDTNNYKIETIDRMEKYYAPEEGLKIDFAQQEANLKKYFKNIKDESYFIYFDPHTMQPLVNNINGTFDINSNSYFLRAGTPYYKWSRTVQRVLSDNDFLGKTLTINADSFPKTFKIVGETYIREQQTQKDSKYQFIINRAQLNPDTNINLSAASDPTTFSMDINVLPYDNGNMIELRQFDVTRDKNNNEKIVAQNDNYTRTYVEQEEESYNDIIVEEE